MMNSNSRWMSATIALIVASLMIGGLEPAAFARGAEEAPAPQAPVIENAPSPALPNRPVIVTSKVAPVDRVAQAISQSQNPRIAAPPIRSGSAYIPPARQNSGKSKKWIWIIAAAAGAGVTAALLAKDDDPEIPEIVIGNPTPGPPQ
jgi:hypothetical protein